MSRVLEQNAYRRGWLAAVEKCAKVVEYACDCTHADIPGLVRLTASDDPIYGVEPLSAPPACEQPQAASPAPRGERDGTRCRECGHHIFCPECVTDGREPCACAPPSATTGCERCSGTGWRDRRFGWEPCPACHGTGRKA